MIWFWTVNRDKELRFGAYKHIEELVKSYLELWETALTFVLLKDLMFWKLLAENIGLWENRAGA